MQKMLNEYAWARWAVLVLVSITMVAAYFFTDVISPLEDILIKTRQWDGVQYGVVTSNYSFFNIIGLLVIGGVILDRLGIRYTGTLFVSLMIVGASLKAYAISDYFNAGGIGYDFFNSFLHGYTPSAKLATAGFAIFGLGSEMAGVTVTKIIAKWFTGKELALAMGLQVALARFGTGLAFLLSPRMAASVSAFKPVMFGCVLLCIGLLTFLIYCFMDKRLDKNASNETAETEPPFRISDITKLLGYRPFLYISLLCVLFYSCVFPFLKFAASIMANKFQIPIETASDIVFLLPFGTIIFTPLFGMLLDTRGKGASLMMLGALLLIISHLIFLVAPAQIAFAYMGIFILGIAFSLVPSAMWPSVTKVCPENRLGTGYSLIFWIQNIGLWLFPMLIGYVREVSNPGITERIQAGEQNVYYSYANSQIMLICVGVLALLFAYLLYRQDKLKHYGLELPNKKPSKKL